MSTTHSRAAIYARVSTDAQVKGRTIDSQLEALTQRIRDDGGSTGPDLRFVDEGHSGSTLIRPALEQLRDLAALADSTGSPFILPIASPVHTSTRRSSSTNFDAQASNGSS